MVLKFRFCSRVLKLRFPAVGKTIKRQAGSYEGEGQMRCTIINKDYDSGLLIDGYSQLGFRLNNNVTVLGPMAIFPRTVLSWNVRDMTSVNEESLTLFKILEPKIDILVMGMGNEKYSIDVSKRLLSFMRNSKISLEILSTDQACAAFNFLNSEGRCVAGALIPPDHINATDDDYYETKMRYQNLYLNKLE